LEQGAEDEAAFQVPLDFSIVEGPKLVLPLEASTRAGYDALAPDTHAYPVLRRSANVAGLGTSILTPTVLGLPADAITRLRWRSDSSSASPRQLALRLGADGRVVPRGVPFPSGATAASVTVHLTGVAVHLDLILRDPDDRTFLLFLGEKGPGTWRLQARLPRQGLGAVGPAGSLATAEQLRFSPRGTRRDEAAPEPGRPRLQPGPRGVAARPHA